MNEIKIAGKEFSIKSAAAEDAFLIVEFMRKLGSYQKMRESTTVEESDVRKLLEEGAGEAVFGIYGGEAVAFIYYYQNSSAFIGEKGIYIDGFYVDEAYRGKGLGKAMMKYMAEIAVNRGCKRLEWGCLDWNEPAIRFYKKLGAKGVDIMTIYRLPYDRIEELAAAK